LSGNNDNIYYQRKKLEFSCFALRLPKLCTDALMERVSSHKNEKSYSFGNISQIVSSNILHAIKCSLRHLLGNDVSLKATYVKASGQHKRSEYSRDISKNMLDVHYSTDGCSRFFQE